MRKTTVYIDEVLLKEAMQAIGANSAKDTIRAGLELLVRRHQRKALQADLGTFEIDLDLKELERMRNDR